MRRQDQVSRHWLRLTILLSVRLSNDSGLAEEFCSCPIGTIVGGLSSLDYILVV